MGNRSGIYARTLAHRCSPPPCHPIFFWSDRASVWAHVVAGRVFPGGHGKPGSALLQPFYLSETMREDLKPGNSFPDFSLPDQAGKDLSLSEAMNGWPVVLTFNRGNY